MNRDDRKRERSDCAVGSWRKTRSRSLPGVM